MARTYKPTTPFTVPMRLLVPEKTERVYGVAVKTMPEDPPLFYGSFRTFGGTENVRDGVYSVVNTATIDTWFRPDITADCRIELAETGEIYEIVADPEDIDRRHQFMQIKVRRAGGKT